MALGPLLSAADSWAARAGRAPAQPREETERRAVSRDRLCAFRLNAKKTSARPKKEHQEDQGDKYQGLLLHFSSWVVGKEGKEEAGTHLALTLCYVRDFRSQTGERKGTSCPEGTDVLWLEGTAALEMLL